MNPAKPANPAGDLGLRWPELQRSRFYKDPLLVMIDEEERVAAVAALKAAQDALAHDKPVRDRYHRLAARLLAKETARLEIQRIMKGSRCRS